MPVFRLSNYPCTRHLTLNFTFVSARFCLRFGPKGCSSLDQVERWSSMFAPSRMLTVAIVKGMATHNLSLMRHSTSSDQLEKWAADFHAWLDTTLLNSTPDDRRKRLIAWAQQAPHARKAHPREEHLLPLLVCVGAAGSGAMSKRWAGWPAGHMSLASYSSP